ncbi:hypothetical protein [Streptomyces sp. B21-083]
MTSGDGPPRVIEREAAIRIVEEELAREYRASSALGVDPVFGVTTIRLRK